MYKEGKEKDGGKVGIRINNGCERKRGGKTKGGSVLNPNPKSTLNNPKHENHRSSSSVNPIPMKSNQQTPEKQKQKVHFSRLVNANFSKTAGVTFLSSCQ